MNYKAPKHIPEGYEWIIVPDPKTIFRGYMRKIRNVASVG